MGPSEYMLGKLTILQKGLVLIVTPLLFQAIFAGVLLWRLALRNDVENWAIHTKEVIAQAETVFRMVVEADSEVNTFALTGEQRMGNSFERSLTRLTHETGELGRLVADNPRQVTRALFIAGMSEQVAGQMRELYRVTHDKDAPGIAAALKVLSDRNLIPEIRKEADHFIGEEEKLDRTRLTELHNTQIQQFRVLLGGMAVLLLIGAVCAWFFGRTIVRRLAVLNENVRRITTGEELFSPISGTDEIALLDHSFHRMADELAAADAKEKAFQESLAYRAAELTVMNRDLSQKSEENEMFVYSVSHDLRSPLVNLQGFSKELTLAMKEMRAVFNDGTVPTEAKAAGEDILTHGMAEPVMFIQTAVTRLSAIIDALLRLSRAGRVEYLRKEVDTAAVVERVIDATRAVIAEKKARVTVVGELPRVWGDPTAVEQIFANIIGNALNYLDKNRPGIIEVGNQDSPGEPALTVCYVKDTGLGIPEAYLGKIFGIFQRVHGNVAVGEGIGLALVRRMVERHGGRIWVESVEGVGSTFFVALPKVMPVEEVVGELPEGQSEKEELAVVPVGQA